MYTVSGQENPAQGSFLVQEFGETKPGKNQASVSIQINPSWLPSGRSYDLTHIYSRAVYDPTTTYPSVIRARRRRGPDENGSGSSPIFHQKRPWPDANVELGYWRSRSVHGVPLLPP